MRRRESYMARASRAESDYMRYSQLFEEYNERNMDGGGYFDDGYYGSDSFLNDRYGGGGNSFLNYGGGQYGGGQYGGGAMDPYYGGQGQSMFGPHPMQMHYQQQMPYQQQYPMGGGYPSHGGGMQYQQYGTQGWSPPMQMGYPYQ